MLIFLLLVFLMFALVGFNQQLSQVFGEFIEQYRLAHSPICSGFDCPIHKVSSESGQNQDWNTFQIRFRPQLLCHLESVHSRHVHVGYYQVWMFDRGQVQAFLPIRRNYDGISLSE